MAAGSAKLGVEKGGAAADAAAQALPTEAETETGAGTRRADGQGLLHRWPWATVALLTLIGTVNYVDRTLPMILAEQLKADLGLSDTMLGVVNGIGFTLVYALAGIPIARIADRGRYGGVIAIALAFWSLMTALGSLASTAWMLIVTRFGVAVGEAGNTPAAHAFVSQTFAPRERTIALAFLTMATAFGSMLGLAGGGLLAQALGWRKTMLILGVAGLALAPIALVLLGRGAPLPHAGQSDFRDLVAQFRKRSIIAIMLAFCFMSMAAYSLGGFGPTFLIRVHGLSVGSAGVQLGLINGFIGIVALAGTGWIASALTARDPRWGLGVLVLLIVVSIPVSTAAFLVPGAGAATVLSGLSYAVMASYMALTVASLHSLVPMTMRAQASAALLLCSGVVGGLGPLFTGVISDRLASTHGPQALGYGLLLVPICLAIGAVFYLVAMMNLRRDLSE